MIPHPGEPWVEEAFLREKRLVLEKGEGDETLAYSDVRQSPAVIHLLMMLTGGTLNLKYIDSDLWETLAGSETERDSRGDAGDKLVVKWVREIIRDAVDQKASDIHIEPQIDHVQVRFRLDGQLRIAKTLGLEYKEEVISHVKVLADLDIAEKRKPQDGKIQQAIKGRTIDFRVSCIPTGKGEKAVIRILDQTQVALNLGQLGMPDRVLDRFSATIHRPYGLLLVTGPTGSGKTTTLYAALNEIKSESLNIMTIEDPIEFQLDGLNQTQVRQRVGFGFSDALRSFLRQDPNVIMVGEIRDLETAEMSIRAALTGHLVLSTLHTNSAIGAIPRLIDMGVESYLAASALQLSVAQRLLRKLCDHCKVQDPRAKEISHKYGFDWDTNRVAYTAKGCSSCGNKGYSGRLGVFESFAVDDSIVQAIHDGKNQAELQALARDYEPMMVHGLKLIEAQKTSFDELLREVVLG